MCETNYESACVILTDNINSMFPFNTGTADIVEGRSFESSDYGRGDAVCMVSVSYALQNNLQVGDSLSLDFYNTEIGYRYTMKGELGAQVPVLIQEPCRPENRMGVKKDYTIVGIYTAPEFEYGLHAIPAGTIFVPKSSVPNAQRYEDYTEAPLLYSAILENGGEKAFEAALVEEGAGNCYEYFDQSYNASAGALRAVAENARRLLWVSAAVFTLAAALYLCMRRMAPAARSMRLLGAKPGVVWRSAAGAYLPFLLVCLLLGAGLCTLLYERVRRFVLSSTVALEPAAVAITGGAQLLLLSVCGMAWALTIANRRLMQRGKQKKQKS